MAKFSTTKTSERQLATQLRKVARVVGSIIDVHTDDSGIIIDPEALDAALLAYSDALGPWAESVTAKILNSIAASNQRAWNSAAVDLSEELRRTLNTTSVGSTALQLQNEQVALIKSLPIEAGEKAQIISQQSATGGIRANEAAKRILNLGNITENRAVLIARTETAKSNAAFTQARASSIGSTHYTWVTAGDADVRETHAELDGKIFAFANPPFIEGEGFHGPGNIWNCRCFADPIIPN